MEVVTEFQGKTDSRSGLVVSPDETELLFTTVEVDDSNIMLVERFQ